MAELGKVGVREVRADGTKEEFLRLAKTGEQVVTAAHAENYEAAIRGNVFCAANQATVTFGVGLSATNATFALYNPANSGFVLVPLDLTFAFSAAPAAAVVVYLAGFLNSLQAAPTGVTELTTQPTLLGNRSRAVGVASSAATFAAAPVILRPVCSIVAASSITPPVVRDELRGQIILPPNTGIILQASAAAAGFVGMTWEEVPIEGL